MPTLPPPEVSELTIKLVEVYENAAERNKSKFARMLDVDRSRSNNWLAGANEPDLKDRALHRRIAMLLGVTPDDVLALAGYDTSSEVPRADTMDGPSGPVRWLVGAVFDGEQLELDEVALLEDGTERRGAESLVDATARFLARAEPDPQEPEGGAAAEQVAA